MYDIEFIVNGTVLDLPADVSIPLTYWARDVKELDTRGSSFSKDITLPGTALVDRLFTHIYEINYAIQTSGVVNFQPDFNPNLKADVIINYGSFTQFKGIMRLLNVSIENYTEHGHIKYTVQVTGEWRTLLTELGDTKLSDLDFSDLDHTYDKPTQQATWSATPGSGYIYPMINYGVNVLGQPVAFNNSWGVVQFFPGVYLKTYIDRIFAHAGFRYTSDFFNSAFFSRLFIPYTGEGMQLGAAAIANRVFSATLSANTSGVVSAGGITATVPIDTESSDPGNVFNTGTGEFTAPQTSTYSFTVQASADVFAITTAGNFQPIVGIRVTVVPTVGQPYPIHTAFQSYGYQSSLAAGNALTPAGVFTANVQAQLQLNDRVRVEVYVHLNPNYTMTGSIGYRVYAGATFSNAVLNTQIREGDPLEMNTCIPKDIKCSDLLTGVIRTFNLMLEPDRSQPDTLYIEPATGFYASGTTVDWTHKLAIDRPLTLSPMGLLDAARYHFKYKPDTDYYNKLYTDEYAEPYGTKTYDVQTDFVKGDKSTEIIFSPTPLEDNTTNDRVIPAIIYTGSNGQVQAKRSNIRLLYYGGLKNTATGWTYTSFLSGNSSESQYPYCGHLDDPASPTLDLSFGVPKRVYYIATQYTDANLFNTYYRQFIEEITDKNSKLVTGYFYLDPIDIHTLSFRNKIFVHDTFYRLYKISDYDKRQLTKVELLKIKDGTPFSRVTAPINGAPNAEIGIESRSPEYGNSFSRPAYGIGSTPIGQVVQTGRDNYIDPNTEGVIVSGERNSVGTGSSRVTLVACSGVTVQAGASNVVCINTSGVTINDSDVVYINGLRQFAPNDAVTVTTNYTVPLNVGVVYAAATGITITLPAPSQNNGAEIVIQRTVGMASTVTVAGPAAALVNGMPSQTLTSRYEAFRVRSDGTNYTIIGRG